MARGKTKAAKAGAGAWAASKATKKAGRSARDNDYVQRLMHDEDLRDNIQTAFESARKAYGRIDGKGPAKAVLDDRKTQKELKRSLSALTEAADTLRGSKHRRKRRRRGGLLLIVLVGAGAAVAMSEELRKRVLDLLFGAEEEFEYTSTTMPPPAVTSEPPPVVTGDPPSGATGTS